MRAKNDAPTFAGGVALALVRDEGIARVGKEQQKETRRSGLKRRSGETIYACSVADRLWPDSGV
jgi:hypothetical protein